MKKIFILLVLLSSNAFAHPTADAVAWGEAIVEELERVQVNNITLKILHLSPKTNVLYAKILAKEILIASEDFSEDVNLIIAIMSVESNFVQLARSSAGAIGLMQVMPFWFKDLKIKEPPYDVSTNLKAGLTVLRFYKNMYLDRYGLPMALLAYNRGEAAVDKDLAAKKNPFNGYEKLVLTKYKKLSTFGGFQWYSK